MTFDRIIICILLLVTAAAAFFWRKWEKATAERRSVNRTLMGVSTATSAKVFHLSLRIEQAAAQSPEPLRSELLDISSNLKDLHCVAQEGVKKGLEASSGSHSLLELAPKS